MRYFMISAADGAIRQALGSGTDGVIPNKTCESDQVTEITAEVFSQFLGMTPEDMIRKRWDGSSVVDLAPPSSSQVALAMGKVQEAKVTLSRVLDAALDTAGSPFDATKLEGGDFGAPAGQGQAYYDALSNLVATLTASSAGILVK